MVRQSESILCSGLVIIQSCEHFPPVGDNSDPHPAFGQQVKEFQRMDILLKGAEHLQRCNVLHTPHYTKHSVIVVQREVCYTRL